MINFYCYPKSLNDRLENDQKHYVTRNVRYTKYLDKRKKSFNKGLMRNKRKYESNLYKTKTTAWKEFQKVYMSQAEKEMTKEEWLVYYEEVIANEKKAMYNSDVTNGKLSRSIELSGYYESNLYDVVTADNVGYVDCDFYDQEGTKLAVRNILVIDPKDKSYTSYQGSLGIGPTQIGIAKEIKLPVILFLANGNVGLAYSSQAELVENITGAPDLYRLKVKVLDKELCHIGMVRDEMGI